MLKPGSLVFVPPPGDVDLGRFQKWWRWTLGASWRSPEGLGSSIKDRIEHPVIDVALDGAMSYADWAGKRLPTEAELELAARGRLDGVNNTWGDHRSTRTCKHIAGTIPSGQYGGRWLRGDCAGGLVPPNWL